MLCKRKWNKEQKSLSKLAQKCIQRSENPVDTSATASALKRLYENRFFGFNYTDYEHAEHVVEIGYPTLTCRGRVWTDKPLRWHPNNRMERFNIPTVAQGGFDYQHTAVLFRRHSGGFEINVMPWNDDGAVAWRTASEALKTVFRLG